MSQNNPNKPSGRALPESQAERWIKYGSNVALTIVLAIVLAVIMTWVAQRARARVDTTKGGSLSLKPQSIEVLKQLKQKITLVSLYARTEQNQTPSDEESPVKVEPIDYSTRIADLLDEYQRNSGQIEIKVIDPLKEKDKLEALHQQFIAKYGSQIKIYKDYLADWKSQYEQIRKLTGEEAERVRPFGAAESVTASDDETPVSAFVRTIREALPQSLTKAKDAVDRELGRKYPDFKEAVDTAKTQMQTVSQLAGSIIDQAPKAQAITSLPAPFRQYLAESVPRYQNIKKLCDDMISRADKLGELKVDQLEQALKVDNPVLVLGENDWRVLSFGQIWQTDTDARAMANGAALRPRFAGEQAITTAIYTLQSPAKQKICFIRPGGSPLTTPGFPPFVQGGPMSVVAERLRDYNFDVTEKDLSGQWAMQAQMQRMPSPPEPSDEEIKDALWVMVNFGSEQQGPPAGMGAKLAEHLKQGGSAVVLVEPRGEAMLDALKDWGVEIRPDAIAVHETIHVDQNSSTDPMEEAKARSYIFDVRNYGDHLLARPEKNLDSIFVPICVVKPGSAQGAKVTALLPLSESVPGLKTWGETDIESLSKNENPTFNADKDIAGPLFGGAAVEKGNGRLVVIGSARFMFNNMIRFADPVMARRGVAIARFPGNMELATNSIFWAAKLDPMIAISPSAMDVSRISGDLSPGMLKFWRIGVLMVLLPGLVIAAGLGVYAMRKD